MLLCSLCTVACSAESRLRKEGKTPYVRCLAGPEPDERTIRSGGWTFRIEKRVLEVQGPARPLRMAAISASGLGSGPNPTALARLRDANPDLLIFLGGIGDGPAAKSLLQVLASLSAPSVVVLGGGDTWAAHDKARDELPAAARVVDGTVLRAIRIGNQTFVPLAGAENGRYARGASACGFDAADLDTAAQELGAPSAGETRWLLSWQAPARVFGERGPRTQSGASIGSPLLARFAEKIGARGGMYAWPLDETAELAAGPLRIAAVPRLFGPRLETSTGARPAHGLLLLEVDASGVRVVL